MGTPPEPDVERPRITFHDQYVSFPRGRAVDGDSSGGPSRAGRSASRSRSRRPPSNSSAYGLPIGYRTLSIHVSESQGVAAPGETNLKAVKGDDSEYFANLSFHTLSAAQVCHQLAVSPNEGLDEDEATLRRQKNGPNVLPHPKTNYIMKLLGYVFGGFCSVLWVGR